jgi:hypothetical protein
MLIQKGKLLRFRRRLQDDPAAVLHPDLGTEPGHLVHRLLAE